MEATIGGTGTEGRQLQLLRLSDSLYVGLQPGASFSPVAQNPMKLKYILGPGTYEFEPTAPSNTATGNYSFLTSTGTVADCEVIVFATPNVQFTDSVKAAPSNYNCTFGAGREQWINLQLKTGMKVRLTLSNLEFNAVFVLRDDRLGPASPTLVSRLVNAGETSVIDWTATFDTWHEVIIASRGQSGKYTLKIEQLP